jgi:hypothetical protein
MAGDIFFCGDVHSHFQHVIDAVSRACAGRDLVLLGIQAAKPLGRDEWILDETEVVCLAITADSEADTTTCSAPRLLTGICTVAWRRLRASDCRLRAGSFEDQV